MYYAGSQPLFGHVFQGAPLPDGSASHVGSELHIENASSKHDGTYKCIANNSVGEPAEAEIKIQVIRKFVISLCYEGNSIKKQATV